MRPMSTELEKECMGVILSYMGIDITEDQFRELMRDNPRLNNQLVKFQSPSDTMDREDLMSAVGRKLAGRDWPTYGDGEKAYETFIKDFAAGARRLGYKMVDTTVDD